MYYFHGDCIKCTKKIAGDILRAGKTKFIIYPFDKKGMKVKSILNVLMGIDEYLVVDDSLSDTYPNVRSLSSLTDEDLKDAVVLIASDEISDTDDIMLQHIFCEEQIDDTGLIMEFGVFKGDSTDFISVYNPTRAVYGFDSFEGLPERWMIDPAGKFTLLHDFRRAQRTLFFHTHRLRSVFID